MKRVILLLFVFIISTNSHIYSSEMGNQKLRDSFFNISICGGLGTTWGELIREEYDSFKLNVTYDDGFEDSDRPDHLTAEIGLQLDITPIPYKLFKIGLRGRYCAYYISQDTSVGDKEFWDEFLNALFEDEDEYESEAEERETVSYGGTLIKYKYWMVGPVLYYFPKDNDYFNFNYFIMYGRLHEGILTAHPSRRDYGFSYTIDDYKSTLEGFKINGGAGLQFQLSPHYTLSIDLFYSVTKLKLNRKLPIYRNIGTLTYVHELSIGASLGFYM